MSIHKLIDKYECEIKELENLKQNEEQLINSGSYNDLGESNEFIGYCDGKIEQLNNAIRDLRVVLDDEVDKILIK